MARNRERYVHGPQSILSVPVASATVIQKGDFVALDPRTGLGVATSSLADVGDAAANREWAADNFLGVALTASANGETADVQVDTSLEAVFQLELQAAASLSFGAALEIHASEDAPSAYQCVAGETSKVAVAVETISAGTDVKCKLLPQVRIHRANPQT